ncbi:MULTISPECIES: pectinesterase family protein [unclassified Chitinophaga]|uniref:pectinesterase family protein n=1 Tax=unclassified Chitinophaga TaxID=2619133 RepID=UPI00300FE904
MKQLFYLLLVIFSATGVMAQQTYPSRLTVAKDGSGDYTTIQEAVNAVRAYSPVPLTITVKNGVYPEKLVIPSWVTNITFIGESRDSTIITNDDYSGKLVGDKKLSTFNSYTVWVQGNDVKIENLTIRNTAGRVGQAVALHVDGDHFVIRNCNLLGNQDTLLTANSNSCQYYENCLIEGTTDFIFGPATALFHHCTIRSLSDSYITAAATTKEQAYGYVFLECNITANKEAGKVYLGRPWRAYARTVFIRCELGKHILPVGWHNWDKTENEQTAFYAEYDNRGEGAVVTGRVPWSKQLSGKQAKEYTPVKILGGWNPVYNEK